jgi:hypothetical protein
VKERGILFSAPMVRAVLREVDPKTQTRRLVKPQPAHGCRYEMNGAGTHALHLADEPTMPGGLRFVPPTPTSRDHRLACPYGQPGDRLWVKETWYDDFQRQPGEAHEMNVDRLDDGRIEGIEYRASHDCANFEAGCPCNPDGDGKRSEWRPSIFMPRWASRITLEVTSVRVERLQDITEEDALAEGVPPLRAIAGGIEIPCAPRYRDGFRQLWDAINGDRATWASNPWVWVVGFKRVPP